ncbi:MAG: exodeoxyribonuclease III [Candidatus Sericytochromatia bacterium]|nr:exodeoxyribonuclease III [Candidatus Sericytochromatia bacterium]
MPPIKIATWNVNGIRAVTRNGFAGWLATEAPDVLCLQEVRALPDQVPAEATAEAGWHRTWHAAERKGYSGVATWTRTLWPTHTGLGEARFDTEGRAIWTDLPDGIRLLNVYVPNGGRDLERVPYKLDFYAAMLAEIQAGHARGERFIICGDWNTAHQPIDLANPKANQGTTGFLPEERAWVDRFLTEGDLVDPFRDRHPGESGHYTWWSNRPGVRDRNIGWRIDYFLVSRTLAPQVLDVAHRPDVKGSDHCPVVLTIGPG